MTHVTCRLTARNRDQLRDRTLGNGVWATFTPFLLNYLLIFTRSVGVYCSQLLHGRSPSLHLRRSTSLVENSKGSTYSITERRVPEVIPVLAGDVSHKPGGGLPLLSARPAVIPQPLRGLLPILLLGEQGHNGCEQFA